MRLLSVVLTVMALAATQRPALAQTAADSAAIRHTALDYIDGWYSGDAARMEGALHSHLAKRLVYSDQHGQSRLVDLTAEELIQSTRAGTGKIPREQWRDSVTVLSVFGNDAVVRIDATTWVDFLEEIKWNGSWKIVNVIWENRPRAAGAGR
jgi:putative lumazine-binding protein